MTIRVTLWHYNANRIKRSITQVSFNHYVSKGLLTVSKRNKSPDSMILILEKKMT